VTVVLSGDGGDELFAGYERYRHLSDRDVPIPPLARAGLRAIARRLPHGAYGRNRLLELSRSTPGRYAGLVARALDPEEGGVANPAVVRAGHDLEHLILRWWDASEGRATLDRLTLVDAQSYLPDDILTKVDRMSMAVSLEARVPVLDHHMAEFAFSLPARLKWGPSGGKHVFRRALASMLPDFVFTKRKQGFGVPLADWFRNELGGRLDALLRHDAPIYEFVRRDRVSQIIAEHRARRRDHSHMIWRLLVLDLWLLAEREPPTRASSAAATSADAIPATRV
jgi:asparagine synthase (glutamine-hydrolysing)